MNLTQEQIDLFEKLNQDRQKTYSFLKKKNFFAIIFKLTTEMYSESSHFILELFQNADDAKATKINIELFENKLIFTHNGDQRFNLTDVDDEENNEDDEVNNTKRIGDINSITSFGRSLKQLDEQNFDKQKIGKFGIGFKAVFQYTETPHIYDPNFKFKIERFIVPKKLDDDLEFREKDETIFYFPFNKDEMSDENAYSDILEKFKKLVFPTLFLTNLKEIKWISENESGKYNKELILSEKKGDINYEKIELFQVIDRIENKEKLILFTRKTEENLDISIGYLIGDNERLTPKAFPAFCFFPTKVTTNLNFIFHAPFLLTDSREGIHLKKNHNIEMIEKLSTLAADSLLILRDLKLIDDNIFDIIPYKKPQDDDFFQKFYYKIKEKFQTEELLPSNDGTYVKKEYAYWTDTPKLTEIFDNLKLADLLNIEQAKWVFTKTGRNDTDKTKYIFGFQRTIRQQIEPNLIKAKIDLENFIASRITKDFTEKQQDFTKKQPFEWLIAFYEYLWDKESYYENFKTSPIFINENKEAVSAFDNNKEAILFLPSEGNFNIDFKNGTINSELLKDKKSKEFMTKFGIKAPNNYNYIYNTIFKKYQNHIKRNYIFDILICFKYWIDNNKTVDIINELKNYEVINYYTKDDNSDKYAKSIDADLYLPTDELIDYFENCKKIKFVNKEIYFKTIKDEANRKNFEEFLEKLGLDNIPKIKPIAISKNDRKSILNELGMDLNIHIHRRNLGRFTTKLIDFEITGLLNAISSINKKRSLFILEMIKIRKDYYQAEFHYAISTYEDEIIKVPSNFIRELRKQKWLLSKNNEFVAPNEITIDDLDDSYEIDSGLEKLLEFKPTIILTEKDRIALKFQNEEEADLAKRLLDEHKAKQSDSMKSKTKISKEEKISILSEQEDNINEDKANIIKNKLIEKIKNAPQKTTEERMRSVDNSINISPFVYNYLKARYEIDEQGVICQICLDSMPFRYKDEDFFEKVEFLTIKEKLNFNYLCLCPNCSQLFRNMKKEEGFKDYLYNKISHNNIQEDNLSTININDFSYKKIKTDKSKKIHFTPNHLFSIKTITESEIVFTEDKDDDVVED